jgi:hypothetical protein
MAYNPCKEKISQFTPVNLDEDDGKSDDQERGEGPESEGSRAGRAVE